MFLHGQSHTSTRMTAQSHYLPRMPLMPRPLPPPPRPRSQFGKFPQNAVRAVARPTRTGSTLRRAGWGGRRGDGPFDWAGAGPPCSHRADKAYCFTNRRHRKGRGGTDEGTEKGRRAFEACLSCPPG